MLFKFEYINNYAESYIRIILFGIKIRFKYFLHKHVGHVTQNSPTFIHYYGVKNIGDKFSVPVRYFDFKNYLYVDYLAALNKKVELTDNIVVGGGVYINSFLSEFLNDKNKQLIAWGIGLFQGETIDFSNAKLVGLRDYNRKEINNKNVFYCPCVSCMHSSFDKKYSVKNNIVAYIHKIKTKEEDYKQIADIPHKTNEDNFEDVINFLGSSNFVITNSYHGVYWATLLGKKVIAIPYNSKFYGYKYPPVYATFNTWKTKINDARAYPDALEDCREQNIVFYKKVIDILNLD